MVWSKAGVCVVCGVPLRESSRVGESIDGGIHVGKGGGGGGG